MGALSRGAHLWINPRFRFATLLNTWTHWCAPRFHGSIQHFAPTILVTWHITSFGKMTGNIAGNLSFLLFCYFLSNWRHEITTVTCTVKNIIDRSQFVDENKHEPMSCVHYSRIKRLFLFMGAHPRVQKHWMTLGLHPWVWWISLMGALHNLTCPWSCHTIFSMRCTLLLL